MGHEGLTSSRRSQGIREYQQFRKAGQKDDMKLSLLESLSGGTCSYVFIYVLEFEMLPHQPIIGMTQSLHPARVEAQVAGLESRMSIPAALQGLDLDLTLTLRTS